MAIWVPWARVLRRRGLPARRSRSRGCRSRAAATPTWRRSAVSSRYVEQADWVVPGHGAPLDAARALAILREDVAYLQALPAQDAPLPLARRSARQRRIHADNVEKVGRGQR